MKPGEGGVCLQRSTADLRGMKDGQVWPWLSHQRAEALTSFLKEQDTGKGSGSGGRTGIQSKCQLSLDSYMMFLICEVWISVLLSSWGGEEKMSGNGRAH